MTTEFDVNQIQWIHLIIYLDILSYSVHNSIMQ